MNKNTTGQVVDFTTLGELIGFQLRQAQLQVFNHFRKTVGATGITPGQAGILILIRNNPDISQAALARAIGVERATLGQIISDMEAKSWVERHPSRSDRRSYALTLSSSGKAFLEKVLEKISFHEQDMTAHLSTEERREFLRLLLKFLGVDSEAKTLDSYYRSGLDSQTPAGMESYANDIQTA